MNALILTGRTLTGFIDHHVWSQVAAIFDLDADSFASRVLARCPISVRETPDSEEAQQLRLRLYKSGAEVELIQTDGSKWQIERDGAVLGPVPLSFLALEHATRRLARDTKVKRTADSTWITLDSAVAGDTATRVSLKRPAELVEPTYQPTPPPTQPSFPIGNGSHAAAAMVPTPGMRPTAPVIGPDRSYEDYDHVPFYRKQWFFWLLYLTISPIAIGILLFGDVYYQKKGKVKSFGTANRVVAGIVALGFIAKAATTTWTAALLPAAFLFNQSTLPTCDSNDARTTLEEIFSNKGITVADISLVGERSFDRTHETRECSATISALGEKDVVHYEIYWAGKDKGIFELKVLRE